ncbi:hypothetical protein TWF788_007682 [Orbilia oligospora]|uniref:Uncharacterized protein n=1 Tax=Orbilia oligospora TaxID=2813651 RepID=A0A7C8PRZ1_ORBOL|nr:hypothetical protein TWF788_007682 [Orbilia oligospora]
MEPIPELFSPSNYQPEAIQQLSLGNLALKAYAKFYLIPSSPGTKEIDELTSELMNGQCLFNYIENTWPKYANYEEDPEVEWEIANLLQQVEWILTELDGMDISDPLTDAQKALILDENTGAVDRVEKLLCAFIDRFHTPVSPKDNQLLEWLNSGVVQPIPVDAPGERSTPGASKGLEPNKRPPRHRVPVGVRKFENAAPTPEQTSNGVTQSNSNDEITLKIIRVQGTTKEEEEYRFPLRSVQPNDRAILSKPMALELSDTEENADAREALRSIISNVLQCVINSQYLGWTKLSKGKSPVKMAGPSNGAHPDTADLEVLILSDKVHRHEETDGFGADNVVAQFQTLVAVEFNTRPSGPISNHDITIYSLLEVGYTDRKRNVPQLRLQNSQGDIIKSAPLLDWTKIETDQVGNPYDVEVWSIRVREMYVSFAICVEQDRVGFSGTCEKVISGAFLKKEKSKSWSIESATYRNPFRAQPLTCRAGELNIKEHLLPGAEGSSRKRSIVVEPRYRGQAGFAIDHIPLHEIEVRDAAPRNTSNGAAIEISWLERAVPQDEYMFSPFNQLRYPRIHHYHLDSQNRLHHATRHTHQTQRQTGPRRLPERTNIPVEHAQSRMVCTYQPNGSYFMQDGVVGEHRYEGSSWTCPYSDTDSSSDKVVIKHWLTLNLTNCIADFYRWLFQKDPDELCLENHIYSSSNTAGNQTNELHVFESELFSERRVLEVQTCGYEQRVKMSFVNTLSSLAYETISPRIQGYRVKDMLSHPYGSRLFDGDVGKDWQNLSSGLSDYGVDTIQRFPIIDIFCPHWTKIAEERALCNFMELTLRPSGQSKSIMRRDPDPIFVRKNGRFKFYQDPFRRLFLLWVYGESGNGFLYFWIKSFPSQILKLNNKLRLSVMYELNSVTGAHAAPTNIKEGIVDISFADSSSSFRRYCQARITGAITGRTSMRETISSA